MSTESEASSALPGLTAAWPSVPDGPPFPTRSIGDLEDCATVSQPIENYCERWVVPMTTQWAAPTFCPDLVPDEQPATWYLTCGPEAFEQVWYNDGYYSPGVCPSGYTVDCTATGSYINHETIMPSESVGMCVPIGYECSWSDDDDNGEIVFWGTRTTTRGSEVLTADRPALQIRWREEDIAYLEVHPLATPSSASVASIPTTEFRTSDEPTTRSNHGRPQITTTSRGDPEPSAAGSNDDSGSSGLATGAIAGIVVGVVGALALLGVGLWICFARRRKQAPQPVAQSDPSMMPYAVNSPPMAGDGGMQQQYQPYQQQQQQPGYYPGGVTSYYDKPPHMAQANLTPMYAHDVPGQQPQEMHSPHMGGVVPVGTPPAPSSVHSPAAQNYAPAPPGLVLGNDLEVVSATSQADQRSVHGLGVEQGDEWERQQLMHRQTALQDRRARLEMEQIEREQHIIQQRLSQMPPR